MLSSGERSPDQWCRFVWLSETDEGAGLAHGRVAAAEVCRPLVGRQSVLVGGARCEPLSFAQLEGDPKVRVAGSCPGVRRCRKLVGERCEGRLGTAHSVVGRE